MKNKKITHAKQVNLKEVKSALIITPFDMEEFILSTPAVAALSDAISKEGKITALTSAKTAGIVRNCRDIKKVYLCRTWNMLSLLKTVFLVLFSRYDVLVNFNPESKASTIMGLLSGAGAKVAYARKKDSGIFSALFNLKLYTLDSPQHKIVKYLNLVRFIGANSYDFTPKLELPEYAKKFAAEFIKKNDVGEKDILIGIHPCLPNGDKRWSLNKFSRLANNLADKYGVKVVVFYHADEKSRLDEFMHLIKNKAVVVDTNDYMKQAAVAMYLSCFVCNETDFMHVFSPFTGILVIWGDSDPDINKPGGHHSEVMQSADGNADSVPVSRVTEHIKKYLNR